MGAKSFLFLVFYVAMVLVQLQTPVAAARPFRSLLSKEVVSKRYQKETVILVLPEVADDAGDRNEQADAVSMCVWVFVSVRQIWLLWRISLQG